MPEIVDFRFRLRRGLAATWTSTNDVLLDGELGLERDTGKVKVGDGATGWNSLPYIEAGLELGRLADVNVVARADGRVLAWSSAAAKHVYVDQSSGGGGGGGGASPLPGDVIHWLTVRHRTAPAAAGGPVYFADSPVAGVGIGAAVQTTANAVNFSEAVNGLRGMRFVSDARLLVGQQHRLADNTIMAVVQAPSTAEWVGASMSNIIVPAANGGPQVALLKSGTDSAYVEVLRASQATVGSDQGYGGGLIAQGARLLITVTIEGNSSGVIRRNGVQTGTIAAANFSQNFAGIGSRGVTGEWSISPILEVVVFDRVLDSVLMAEAENYLMGIWGIV